MPHKKFSVYKRLQSFKFALNGLKILINEEHNAGVQFFIAFLAIVLGFWFDISIFEWIAIIITIGFVIVLEIVNSTFERVANFICPQQNQKIKEIKDLSAAGVLLAAISAMVVGAIIFIPKIIKIYFYLTND